MIKVPHEIKLERELHALISNDLIRRQIYFVHSYTHKRTTQEPGVPDFIICIGGCAVGIEVKMPGNDLSDVQQEHKDRMVQSGWFYYIVRSFQEFADVLKKF